jgi:hypothetical protein
MGLDPAIQAPPLTEASEIILLLHNLDARLKAGHDGGSSLF